ncbi:MAG: hypothetical protein RIM99_18065 [Cyclobacteriaceae bacterium]
MDFKKFSREYAEEIGGQYQDYDDTRAVIVLPLKDNRFQTVTGHIVYNQLYNREVVQLKTKVCRLDELIPYEELLTESSDMPYSKFVIEGEFLKVEATSFLVNLNENMIKEMFSEVANIADDWEFRITGKDIH